VESVVRAAIKGQSAPANTRVSRPGEQLPQEESARDIDLSETEKRHLRQLALIVSRHPEMVTDSQSEEFVEVLPESALKRLIFAFVDAGAEGHVDGEGRVDLSAIEGNLPPELAALAYQVIVDEDLYPQKTPAAEVLTQIVRRFVLKNLDAEQKMIKRRLNDPDEDQGRALEELQALLVRRRAQGGDLLDTST